MEIWRVKGKRLTCGKDVEDSSMEARRWEPLLKAASKQGMKAFPLPPSFVFCNLEVTEHWLPSSLLCNYGIFENYEKRESKNLSCFGVSNFKEITSYL